MGFQWRLRAVCKGQHAVFDRAAYGNKHGSTLPEFQNTPDRRDAYGFCQRCPVRDECLEAALENDEQGYWAGTTDRMRRRIKKRRKRVTRQGVAA